MGPLLVMVVGFNSERRWLLSEAFPKSMWWATVWIQDAGLGGSSR